MDNPRQRLPGASSLKDQLLAALAEFATLDLRPSHLIVAAMIVLGGLVNLLFAHGWTVWPIVFAAALMTAIHEAADRTGQGVPPLRVYAFFVGVVVAWLSLAMILSALSPFVLLLGLVVLGYYCLRGYRKKRQRDQLIAFRRSAGLCIFCGTPVDPQSTYCQNCLEEPDPESARADRVRAMAMSPQGGSRARAALSGALLGLSPSQKEQALMARRRGRQRGKS